MSEGETIRFPPTGRDRNTIRQETNLRWQPLTFGICRQPEMRALLKVGQCLASALKATFSTERLNKGLGQSYHSALHSTKGRGLRLIAL